MSYDLRASDLALGKDGVYVVNNQTVNTPGMLLIWADFCGHCHRFLPEYEKLCQKLGRDFKCAKIENEELKLTQTVDSALQVDSFPTIMFFDQWGRLIKTHKGARDEATLMNEICNVFHHCISHH